MHTFIQHMHILYTGEDQISWGKREAWKKLQIEYWIGKRLCLIKSGQWLQGFTKCPIHNTHSI